MEILDEKDGVDTELLVYAMTLINKVCVPPGSICVDILICNFFTAFLVQRVFVSHLFDAVTVTALHCFSEN